LKNFNVKRGTKMGETEDIQKQALEAALGAAVQAMKDAETEILRLRSIVTAAHQFALDFPCTCWINQPKCPTCQLVEMTHND
jgi:hypothetical protein